MTVRERGLGWNNNPALVSYLKFSALITTLTCKFDNLKACLAQ